MAERGRDTSSVVTGTGPLAAITEIRGLGMILIRADLTRAGDALAEAAGLAVPATTRFTTDGARWLGWMAPDELLLILPATETAATLAALRDALSTEPALIEDVSAMRCVFDLSGTRAAEVLMKLTPADLSALPADGVRRTRAAQVACALWRHGDGWRVIAFRSIRDYLAEVLARAAAPGTGLAPR